MTRELKVGIAVLVVLALGAIGASGASAYYIFTPGADPAWLTAEQFPLGGPENKFEIGAGIARVECNHAYFEDTVEGTSVTQITVKVKVYEECTTHASGISAAAVVDMNSCGYLLTGETNLTGHGIVHIECPQGHAIEITTPSVNCTIKIHEQTPTSGGVSYENTTGTPDYIDARLTVEGITDERSGGILCAASGIPSEGNNTKLLEKITIEARKDNNGQEGARVNLTVS